jgi:DNA segregation ATPase FtsK/SpoIIIE, S-DNA-T family
MVVEEPSVPAMAELLGTSQWQTTNLSLPLALGSTAKRQPFLVGLTELPHLFITGCTGSGKTVCVDGILISLLHRHDSNQVRLLLIDPNRIDLHVYSQLPHLISPVIADAESALPALRSIIDEMDNRSILLSKAGVRNIDGFNGQAMGLDTRLPNIVVVISDLVPLLRSQSEHLLKALVHLSEKGRGVGVHLILASQRPPPKVFDEIKTNIPARLCFRLTNAQDSVAYLDERGAEALQGIGAFIYRHGGHIERGHSAFVSEEDIQSVVTFWKENAKTTTTNQLMVVDEISATHAVDGKGVLPSTEPTQPTTTSPV